MNHTQSPFIWATMVLQFRATFPPTDHTQYVSGGLLSAKRDCMKEENRVNSPVGIPMVPLILYRVLPPHQERLRHLEGASIGLRTPRVHPERIESSIGNGHAITCGDGH